MEVASAVPPLEAAYHCIVEPVAIKLATVGLLIAQNAWAVEPVGAAGLLIVTVTSSLVALSQPETVCEA